MSVLGSLELALVLGMRHALEADHVAAVGTLIDEPPRAAAVASVAARWALGHAAVLFVVGVALVTMGLRLPERFELGAELLVASVLIALGVRRLLVRSLGTARLAHGAFAVGALHGLAGSGPMALLAVTTLDQQHQALAYLALVALGTLLGMVALAGLLSWPLSRLAGRPRVRRGIELFAGLLGIFAGVRLAASLF